MAPFKTVVEHLTLMSSEQNVASAFKTRPNDARIFSPNDISRKLLNAGSVRTTARQPLSSMSNCRLCSNASAGVRSHNTTRRTWSVQNDHLHDTPSASSNTPDVVATTFTDG
ncbi:hypothetical protein ACG7TL_002503 [Trametes sanguinea]